MTIAMVVVVAMWVGSDLNDDLVPALLGNAHGGWKLGHAGT